MTLGRIVRIGNQTSACAILWCPLMGAGGTLGELPFVAKKILKKIVAPFGWRLGPDDFQAAANRIGTLAAAEFAFPTEALLFNACRFRFCTNVCGIACAVSFSECVATCNQRNGFLVVHRHTAKCFANVSGCRNGIRFAVWTFRIHIDQSHLHSGKRILKIAIACVALVTEPLAFWPPVKFFRFPNIGAATTEAESLEANGLKRDVARENHQVSPGNLPAVFLLDWPEQTASSIEVHVVRPTIQRCETLLTGSGAAAAIADSVGSCAVPSHADEQPAIVTEVCRPPVLRIGHQRVKVFDDGIQIETLELLGVVEVFAHRIGQGGMLVKDLNIQLIRPPFAVCGSGFSCREWALAFG